MKVNIHWDEKKELLAKQAGFIVYRRFGKTYLRKAQRTQPKKTTKKHATIPKCLIAADKFAKAIIADPATKVLFEKMANGQCSAYAKAVSEFMLTH